MARGILRDLTRAERAVVDEIRAYARSGEGKYPGGLASEGYKGGYRDALADVGLMLRGCPPCKRPEYWEKRDGW